MPDTVTIPKEEYEELMKYKRMMKSNDKFNFNEVFDVGSGKLKGQEVKDTLREEW